jgi:hypothetical protein
MSAVETSERISGAALLSVPAFEFFVWGLDNYARLELAVKLHDALPPFLLNPATGFICMCLGLALLYVSQREHMARIVEAAQTGKVLDSTGKVIGREVTIVWPKTVGIMFFLALIAAAILAIAYSLAYKGMPPIQASMPPPPKICKTADCFPKRTTTLPSRIGDTINQNGITNIVQKGHHNQLTVNPEANPNLPIITYSWDGIKHTTVGTSFKAEAGNAANLFQRIRSATNRKDWDSVVTLSLEAQKEDPDWLTPYYTAGVAYEQLCNKDDAIKNLAIFVKRGTGAPEYDHPNTRPLKGPVGDSENNLKILKSMKGSMCS